jgi:hypothetical protein
MTIIFDVQWCLGIVGALATAVMVLAGVKLFLDRFTYNPPKKRGK